MPYNKNRGREALFDLMRNYHLNVFPDSFATKELAELRENFQRIEEQTISMILSFVYGKAGFVDSSQKLSYFIDESAKLPKGDLKVLYTSKIEQLQNLLKVAETQSKMDPQKE